MKFVASIVVGVASLTKSLSDGRTQMVGLLLPSDFMGRPGRSTIEFDVQATTDVTLCCFDRLPFENLVEDTPHVAQRLLELSLDELDAARDWMLLLGRKSAQEKVATFVEMMVRRASVPTIDESEIVLDLPLTRDQISNFLGLTLETVSRHLSAMKSKKIISFGNRGSLKIHDLAALRNLSGDSAEHI